MAKGKYEYWLTKDGLTLLQGWARDGLIDEQIAHNIGITKSTLYLWKTKYVEFSDALKKGKEVVDIEVENALLKRAIGYEYTEQKIEVDEKGGRKVIQTAKQVAPDTAAAFIWLKNRLPDKWRDKPPAADDTALTINENMVALAEIVRSSVPDRKIKDIE